LLKLNGASQRESMRPCGTISGICRAEDKLDGRAGLLRHGVESLDKSTQIRCAQFVLSRGIEHEEARMASLHQQGRLHHRGMKGEHDACCGYCRCATTLGRRVRPDHESQLLVEVRFARNVWRVQGKHPLLEGRGEVLSRVENARHITSWTGSRPKLRNVFVSSQLLVDKGLQIACVLDQVAPVCHGGH